MRKMIALAALLGSIVPAYADNADKNIEGAVIVEWMVAHCDHEKIPAATVGLASMTLSGAEADAVKAKRATVKERIASEYSTTDAACEHFFKSMK